jgi:predicted nuclease with TOPRIM domain
MDAQAEEKELKNKLQELEKELALSDEEFERRLIERLKKGMSSV